MAGIYAVNGQAPGLGPLQDNGGSTFTHALREGSPAIDSGGDTCPDTDQRGVVDWVSLGKENTGFAANTW